MKSLIVCLSEKMSLEVSFELVDGTGVLYRKRYTVPKFRCNDDEVSTIRLSAT